MSKLITDIFKNKFHRIIHQEEDFVFIKDDIIDEKDFNELKNNFTLKLSEILVNLLNIKQEYKGGDVSEVIMNIDLMVITTKEYNKILNLLKNE